jgi:hypothetical protein
MSLNDIFISYNLAYNICGDLKMLYHFRNAKNGQKDCYRRNFTFLGRFLSFLLLKKQSVAALQFSHQTKNGGR